MIAGRFGSIISAEVHAGTPALREAIEVLAGRAARRIDVELFRMDDAQVLRRFAQVPDDGRVLGVLADTDSVSGRAAKRLRAAAGDGWTELGADPIKQHAKSVSIDEGVAALVATDIADGGADERVEVGVTVIGDAAKAIDDVRVAAGGGAATLEDAMVGAARAGVLYNDPRVDAAFATEAIEALIEQRGSPLKVTTKLFNAESIADRIAVRAADDPVEIVTHDMPKRQRRLLERAGATVHLVDEDDARKAGTAIHGTVLESGDHVLVGSPYLEEHVLYGSKGRRSRELAVLLEGAAADGARAAARLVGAG